MNKLLSLFAAPGPIQPTSATERAKRAYARMAIVAIFVFAAILMSFKATIAAPFGGFMGSLLDAEGLLSDGQAVTATALSTNTYDSGAAGNEIGAGEPMGVCITVDVAAVTTTGDETYRFSLVQSANADLSSSDELLTTNTSFITRTVLVAGYEIVIPIPAGMKTKRYLGLNYTTAGNADRAITVTARIGPLRTMGQKFKSYASGYSVTS